MSPFWFSARVRAGRWWGVLLVLVVFVSGAEAQGTKSFRIGMLSVSVRSVENSRTEMLPLLAKYGFAAGGNVTFIGRFGGTDRLPGLMQEILAAKPDVILAVGGDAIRAARMATETVPIVIFGPDPVRLGVADSISRPGGNVTGIIILATELDGKRIELAFEAVPSARRMAALVNPTSPNRAASEHDMRAVAAALGIDLNLYFAAGPADYPRAFAAMRAAGMGAVAIVADPEFYRDTAEIALQARLAGLPAICQWAEMAAAGCLLSYGPNLNVLRERQAYYLASILKGTKPSDLPIEQPSKLELIVNLKTAKALGLTIPERVMLRADEVIE